MLSAKFKSKLIFICWGKDLYVSTWNFLQLLRIIYVAGVRWHNGAHSKQTFKKKFHETPQRMREFILKLNILQSFNAQLLCCDTILTFNLKFLHDLLFLTSKKSAKFISFPGCALCSNIVKKNCPTLYCMLYNTILYLN